MLLPSAIPDKLSYLSRSPSSIPDGDSLFSPRLYLAPAHDFFFFQEVSFAPASWRWVSQPSLPWIPLLLPPSLLSRSIIKPPTQGWGREGRWGSWFPDPGAEAAPGASAKEERVATSGRVQWVSQIQLGPPEAPRALSQERVGVDRRERNVCYTGPAMKALQYLRQSSLSVSQPTDLRYS